MSDTDYCEACGRYVPPTLAGARSEHDCGRTPPQDGLPPNLFVCPACFGHGAHPWGCWGTPEHPHEHAYMKPLRALLAERQGQG